jgi:predicted ATP-dependent endonuclease of OLD family
LRLTLELENFRGVKKGSIELGDLNILLGGNNSGKTTILESLFLAPNPLRNVFGRPAITVLNSLHSTLGSEAHISFFHNYSGEIAHIICADESKIEIKFQRVGKWIEVRIVANGVTYLLGELLASGKDYGLQRPVKRERVSEGGLIMREDFADTNPEDFVSKEIGEALYFHPQLMKDIWEYFKDRWGEYRGQGLPTKIAKKISEGVAGDYDDLLLEPFIGGQMALSMRSRDGRCVRLGDVGSGVQVLTTLMLLYESIKPKMMLIDDVESHMNPSLLMHTTRWFSDILGSGTRLVISTHSLEEAEFIAETLEEQRPEIILLALREGILSTKHLTLEELKEVEKAGIDPRMAEGVLL